MLSQEQANEAWGHINAFITNRDGDIFQEQPWGTRRLAYPIHQGSYHFLEGNYRLIRFSTEKPFNQALENYLRMDERVLRSLVISIPNRETLPDPAAARPAPAPAAPAPTAAPATEGGESPAEAATAAETPAPAVEAGAAVIEAVASEVDLVTGADPSAPAATTEAATAPEAPAAAAEQGPVAAAEALADAGASPAEEEQSEA
jgi:ribosomal protein S6